MRLRVSKYNACSLVLFPPWEPDAGSSEKKTSREKSISRTLAIIVTWKAVPSVGWIYPPDLSGSKCCPDGAFQRAWPRPSSCRWHGNRSGGSSRRIQIISQRPKNILSTIHKVFRTPLPTHITFKFQHDYSQILSRRGVKNKQQRLKGSIPDVAEHQKKISLFTNHTKSPGKSQHNFCLPH